MTRSLRSIQPGAAISRILQAAIAAVDPYQAVMHAVHLQGQQLEIGGRCYDLSQIKRIWLVGAGKASGPMGQAIEELLGNTISGGVIIVKDGHLPPRHLAMTSQLVEASHPLPDERGVRAAHEIETLLINAGADDLVLALISGGGSALLTCPPAGVTLDDLQRLTSALLACGADINQINTLRKHLDQLKGGRLARLAFPAQLVSLVLSDVVGDPLDTIASGPCVADPSTYQDALDILHRFSLIDQTPQAILKHLQNGVAGVIPESVKPGEHMLQRVHNVLVGNNRLAAQAALQQARLEGFNTLLLSTFLQGEARHVGRAMAAILHQAATTGQPLPPPVCLVAGGETTVTLQGKGKGGRNQEMALAAVSELGGLPNVAFLTLATDGGDGPTDAAGAVVTGQTMQNARSLGLDPQTYLTNNDAYHFFSALGDLLITGPTRTNVNDLCLMFAW